MRRAALNLSRPHAAGPLLQERAGAAFQPAETRFKKTIDLAEWLWHNSH
jgi:hypothetical protein